MSFIWITELFSSNRLLIIWQFTGSQACKLILVFEDTCSALPIAWCFGMRWVSSKNMSVFQEYEWFSPVKDVSLRSSHIHKPKISYAAPSPVGRTGVYINVYSQYQRKIYIFQRAVQTEIQGLRLCLAACHALLRPGLSPPIVLMLLLSHQ